ncbi:hypothetical protein L2755_11220 [Shewanella abyssi]|uniref:hypothetical protein n=1 Tax=Shewanella abyssi TaxID=311789 RepID=UPI00200FDEA4|nr:hypothetical protein [Shewanella abyssi]MCL1050194.1 hypothetical protein [Shewanella abyssi]
MNIRRTLFAVSVLFCSSAAAYEQPIVVSYAVQPINHFNQQLSQAQVESLKWTQAPESISAQYSGDKFALARVNNFQGKVITYSVSQQSDKHPKMLLILSMEKQKGLWTLDDAKLTWQCKNGLHFGTDRC